MTQTNTRYGLITGFVVVIAAIIALLVLAGCGGDDNKATEDLPQDKILTHALTIDVLLNADRMPNLAHGCWETTGFWTTTDRIAIIVYNDHLCPGASVERPMTVINGNPQDVVNAGG
jgi:hypothetical protein